MSIGGIEMKLALISLFKPGFGGGTGRVALDMARWFSAKHEVALVCPGDSTRLQTDENGLRVLSIKSDGEGHICLPRLSQKNVHAMFDFLDEFMPAIIHVHEPFSLSLMGQIWAKMHKVPFVYTAHVLPSRALDFGASDMFKFLSNQWTESLAKRMLQNFYENCDAVIALNGPAAADITQFGYKGKLFTIPNGRDLDTLGCCQVADVTSPTKVLVFMGFVNHRKNQRYLIQVLEQLPSNYVLYIVGEAMDADYGRQIEQLARDKGLDNVILTGPVAYETIPGYLQQAHAFVSASKMEVQSLAVIEALASGTPVVGLSNETIDELVDEKVGCWLPENAAPVFFARHVSEICNLSRREYAQMCCNARRRVAHLGWPRVQEMTFDAYDALLSECTANEDKPEVQVDRIIALIPSKELHETLIERVTRLNRTPQGKNRPQLRLQLLPITRESKRVSPTTWIYVGLTRFICAAVSLTWRLGRSLRTKPLRTEGAN